MSKEIKKKDEKIKKKDKVIEIQKKEANDLKKDLTTNTFYTNNIPTTLKQQMIDANGIKREEKFESPQVVVPINSIFTDQELNALDFEESCRFDRRTLCQVYLSFINSFIGYIKIKAYGEIDYKIYQNYKEQGFLLEGLIGLLSICDMNYLYCKIKKSNETAQRCFDMLGFAREELDETTYKYTTRNLDDVKRLCLKA